MKSNLLFLFIGVLIGCLATFLITYNISSSKYTMLREPDTENTHGDLIILNNKTGEIYISNTSTGYKQVEKQTIIK